MLEVKAWQMVPRSSGVKSSGVNVGNNNTNWTSGTFTTTSGTGGGGGVGGENAGISLKTGLFLPVAAAKRLSVLEHVVPERTGPRYFLAFLDGHLSLLSSTMVYVPCLALTAINVHVNAPLLATCTFPDLQSGLDPSFAGQHLARSTAENV